MAEYIEREAVVRELNKTYDNMNAMGAQFYGGFMNAVYRIKDFPAADVAPVRHARWEVVVGSDGKEHMVCTGCRKQQDLTGVFSYCPNCGAKMDLED